MWYYIDNIIDENFFYSINKEASLKQSLKQISRGYPKTKGHNK